MPLSLHHASYLLAFQMHSKNIFFASLRITCQKNLCEKIKNFGRGAIALKTKLKCANKDYIFDVVFLFSCWTNDSTVLSHTRLWLEQIILLIIWLVRVHLSSSFDMLALLGQKSCYDEHCQDIHDASCIKHATDEQNTAKATWPETINTNQTKVK